MSDGAAWGLAMSPTEVGVPIDSHKSAKPRHRLVFVRYCNLLWWHSSPCRRKIMKGVIPSGVGRFRVLLTRQTYNHVGPGI